MYRARADFDNVVVTPSPLTTVFVDDFATASRGSVDTQRQRPVGIQRRRIRAEFRGRRSTRGDWRHRPPTRSSRRACARSRGHPRAPRSAGPACSPVTTTTRNYYYLHLRSGGTVSLRKLVNGTIFTLASAPLAVSLNTQYALRLEVVGNQLRGYVNGNLLLQATDSSHAAGISGLMTNKAATQFDDYVAYQP